LQDAARPEKSIPAQALGRFFTANCERLKSLPPDIDNAQAGILFVPVPIQDLGPQAEPDPEVVRKVLGLNLAALPLPQSDQRRLFVDYPSIRTSNEEPSTKSMDVAYSLLPARPGLASQLARRSRSNLWCFPGSMRTREAAVWPARSFADGTYMSVPTALPRRTSFPLAIDPPRRSDTRLSSDQA